MGNKNGFQKKIEAIDREILQMLQEMVFDNAKLKPLDIIRRIRAITLGQK